MLWTFIVTWHQLSNSKNSTNRNTYQAILNTNGFYLFTLFIYHKLQGSQGSSSIHSQIGFNTGDKMKYYKEKMYFSPLVLTIVNDSNIDILDQFVFHTSDNFSDIQYVTSTGLQVSSFRGSIYGRYEFRLHGICFNKSVYEIHIHNQIFNDCRVFNSLYIVCLMPMLMDSDKIKIELYGRENKILIDSTEFLAHVPEDHGEIILSNYDNLTHQIVYPNNDELNLQFQSNAITRKYRFQTVIYDYATQLSSDNQILYNRIRQRIDLGLDYVNLSTTDNLNISYNMIFPVKTNPN
ncbi:unnamed protein product, partial [Rotaria sp. Silwood2]